MSKVKHEKTSNSCWVSRGFKSLMSKVKQVVEEETNTTAPEGFKSLMSKVKRWIFLENFAAF